MTPRILITGNLGYIGSVIAGLAIEAGYRIVGFDSDLFQGCDLGGPPPACEQILKDLREIELSDLKGFDAVLHFAGLCNDPLGDLSPDLTMDINYASSLRVAKLAKKAGVRRFVMASSCSLYGASGDSMIDESGAFQPLTVYARSKAMVEEAVTALASTGFSPIFLRNATAYGVSPRLRLDLVLNDFVAGAYTTGVIPIKSDGTPWRPVVHVEDIARACFAVLEAPRETIHNRAFNVGQNEENYQVRDLARIVQEVVPGSRIEYSPNGGPDLRCYRVDFGRIQREIPDFRPRWNARRGAEQLYRAFQNFGLTAETATGTAYRRLARVKALADDGAIGPDLRWSRRVLASSGSVQP